MTGVLIPAATEAEWLAERRKRLTASRIACALGLAPESWEDGSPFALYHRMLGNLPDPEDSLSLRVGRHFESLVCDLFAERHPEFDLRGDGRQLYAHPERDWEAATPDGLIYDANRYDCACAAAADPEIVCTCIIDDTPLATFDAKTAASYDGWGEDGSDDIPVYYRCQKLWQMDVIGVTTGFLACLFTHTRRLRVYEVTLDGDAEHDLKIMREEGEAFMARLAARDEPEIDWRPATTAALKTLHPGVEDADVTVGAQLARSYRAAVRRYKEAERRKDLMANRVLAAVRSGRRAVDPAGRLVATRSVYPQSRINIGRLRAEHPAVAAACTVTKPVTKLLPAKEAKPCSETSRPRLPLTPS